MLRLYRVDWWVDLSNIFLHFARLLVSSVFILWVFLLGLRVGFHIHSSSKVKVKPLFDRRIFSMGHPQQKIIYFSQKHSIGRGSAIITNSIRRSVSIIQVYSSLSYKRYYISKVIKDFKNSKDHWIY